MSILIVDDDPTIRDLSAILLKQAGFTDVRAAAGPKQAFEWLGIGASHKAALSPNVILMDIMMPEMDGIEACARIKRDARFADVPVLMVTTLDDVEHLKKAFLAGATDYMIKPIRPEELLARVRSAHRLKCELDRRRLREEELRSGRKDAPVSSLSTDPLTGWFGEAALLEALERALKLREGVLAVIAIDAWEAFMSRYGRQESENALKRIARALSGAPAALGDSPFTLGGARFAVLHPHAGAGEAERLSSRLREAVAALDIPHGFSAAGAHVTASIATISMKGWERSRADLLAEAYGLLKKAQSAGGNRHQAYS